MSLRFGLRPLELVACALVAGCTPSPVRWSGDRTVDVGSAATALTPTGLVTEDSLGTLAMRLVPPTVSCAGSLQLARMGGRLFAVWWSPRPDSSAMLASASSGDGGATWSAAVPVDTTDRGMTGCARVPAAIAADAASGYVHVTYAMLATEGPGIFFAHSMDRGASFHAPVPILYGERLGRATVAAEGDFVVVAFEDPSSRTPRIGLAVSRTMGHIFEDRVLPVSDDNGAAAQPLVALHQHRLTVAWQQRAADRAGIVLRIRSGNLP